MASGTLGHVGQNHSVCSATAHHWSGKAAHYSVVVCASLRFMNEIVAEYPGREFTSRWKISNPQAKRIIAGFVVIK